MIIIRRANSSDAEGIASLVRLGLKRKSWAYTGRNTYTKKDFESLKKNLAMRSSVMQFIAVDSEENKIVGMADYRHKKAGRTRHRIDLGWGVHPDYEGKGIGTSLLKHLLLDAKKRGVKRAEAEMAVKNIGSWKMALKCGFEIEGTKRKALLTDDGKYVDSYIVGKLI